MGLFLGWLFFSALVGFFGASRGRDGFGWFLISAILSPLIGFIILLVIADLKKEAEASALRRREEARRDEERARDHEKQLEALRAITASSDVAAGRPALSLADEIEKLGHLRDKGLLTEEEFQAQKSAVLARA